MGIKLRISNKSHHHNESFGVCINNTSCSSWNHLQFSRSSHHILFLFNMQRLFDIAVDVISAVYVLFALRDFPYVKSVNTAREEQRTARVNVNLGRNSLPVGNVLNNALEI